MKTRSSFLALTSLGVSLGAGAVTFSASKLQAALFTRSVPFGIILGIVFWLLSSNTTFGDAPLVTLELSSDLPVGTNSRVFPSSQSLSNFDFRHRQFFTINNAFFTRYIGVHDGTYQRGNIDLTFKATVLGESSSQTASFKWTTYDNLGNGANGATGSLDQNTPLVFSFSFGSMQVTNGSANTNLLGQPLGSTEYGSLFLTENFVPEPDTLVLLGVWAVLIFVHRPSHRLISRRRVPLAPPVRPSALSLQIEFPISAPSPNS